MLLAMDSGNATGKIPGIATQEPAFNTPATWIDAGGRDQAEMLGYTVVEPVSVLATHLTEVVRKHADEILNRDATKHLVDELKKTSPAVVDELIPGQMKLAEVQQILQLLLREQVPIRQLGTDPGNAGRVCSADQGPGAADRIRPASAGPHHFAAAIATGKAGCIVVTLDPAIEDRIRAGLEHSDRGLFVRMSPQAIEATCRVIAAEVEKLTVANHPPVIAGQPADPGRPEAD